ncbi:MAG: phosphodiester glycosidase family protein [Planctomycetota bacterium]|nr:phosphodiester glycosidase family protein [Planctomycetota bacterium]MDA1139902.1 phosphodiester glycosidase family protein [Planctomycetota bacterium]
MSVRRWRPLLCFFAALLNLSDAAPADLKAERLFEGVRYGAISRSEPRAIRIHVVELDLDAQGVRLLVTPPNLESKGGMDEVLLQKTSTFAQTHKLQVAINGSFFMRGEGSKNEGEAAGVNFFAAHDGQVYSQGGPKDQVLFRWSKKLGMELWVEKGKAPWEYHPGDGQMALGMARWAQLVRDGEVIAGNGKDQHPRTAIGLSKDQMKAWMVVVDGRQWGISEGMTLSELAALMKELGAHSAINLDGGGSTTMVIQQPDGRYKVVNRPSDYFPLSMERPCGTHIGVFAEKRMEED